MLLASMPSTVYETVGRPSVCLSHHLPAAAVGFLLSAAAVASQQANYARQ